MELEKLKMMKTFLYFLKKKLFLYLREWNFFKKLLIFQEGTFKLDKNVKTHSKKIHIFR